MDLGSSAIPLVTAFSVFFASFAFAAPTLEDYGALPTVENVALSPDGKLLAFKKNDDQREVIAVVSIADNKFVQGLDVSDIKVRNLYFFNDTKLVSVTSDHRRVMGYRGSFDVSTAFLVDVPSGEIDQLLVPGDVIYKGQSGLGKIIGVSADSEHVFMPAFVAESKRDQVPNYALVKVDLDSPRHPAVLKKGSDYTIDYAMDSKGNLLAEERFSSRARKHTITAYLNDEEREIFSQTVDMPETGIVGVTADGKSLVISERNDQLRRGALTAMQLADGKLTTLFARDDADVEWAITDVNRTVFGAIYSGLRPSYEFFDKQVQGRVEAIVAAYPKHSVWLVDWSADWQHLLVKVEGQSTSGDFLLYSQGQKPKFLASARPNIKPEHINPVIEFSYPARDGMTIPALVTVPRERVESLQNLPAIMLPHGGPSAHDWLGFDWLAQALASRGYLVIQPQFRGSSGFGYDHWQAGHGQWGKAMQDDLADGIEVLVKQKLVDPGRICIVGASYGGYAALAGGALTPETYRCVVSINGVTDLNSMLADEKSAHGRDHYVVRYWKMLMSEGKTTSKELSKISPAELAGNFQAPVLLLHGKEDTVVEFSQAKRMAKQLKKANKSVKLVKLDGEDHFLSKSATRTQTLREVVAFVDKHLTIETK